MTKNSGFRKLHSPHTSEFSRRAKSYSEHNIIQKKVVRKLIEHIDTKPQKILDLGCGSGAVYQHIDWEINGFTGIDKADQMCLLHPKDTHITLLHEDFENKTLLKSLGHFDMVISSSAMQWANDLDGLLHTVSQITDQVAFAIFCDGTFKTIYDMTGMQRFLPKSDQLIQTLRQYYDFRYEIENYRLDFPDNLSKFRYIKHSGVSGGQKKLSVRQTRNLIRNYPLGYLEFEVLFVWGSVKTLQ